MIADDKTVVEFNSAKQSHTFNRAEDKVEAMRKAFKLSREEANPKKAKNKKKSKKKSKKK
jgi:hypothetical protein